MVDSQSMMIQKVADIHLIEFTATSLLDAARIEEVGRELDGLIEQSGHPKFIIDFSNVTHISSAAIGVIISAHKKAVSMKGELRLAAIGPRIYEVFKLTKLDKLLKIYPDTDKALKKF